jgi:hypothetical protein
MTKSRPPGPAASRCSARSSRGCETSPLPARDLPALGEVVRFEFLGFHGALLHGAEANRYILIDAVDNFQVGPVTLRAGALCEARQTAQSQQSADGFPTVPLCEKQVISTDGA